jgi:hypothetical protein
MKMMALSPAVKRSLFVGSLAIGAGAFGAVAIGALMIGAMAIRKLKVLDARLERVELGDVHIHRLSVDSLELPPPRIAG